VAIGHVTRDLLPDGSFTPGGTVTFAALTASRLGLSAGIVTCADEVLLQSLPALLPQIALAAVPASVTTAFENSYHQGLRTQYLRACAPALQFADIPPAWLSAPVLLLAPLAQEIPPTLIRQLPRQAGSLLAATPQGWLRHPDAAGRVWPSPWEAAETLLPLLDVLVLSRDDLLPFAGNQHGADALLADWSARVPLLIATDGRHGATLFERGVPTHFPGYPAVEVDPTGAGDVFAAALLVHLHLYHQPHAAMNFANCVASLSVEGPGIAGIPDLEMIWQRLKTSTL
jgi:sugar/nucleoside kinase (ribokinase family)